jgi:hypothetical protein
MPQATIRAHCMLDTWLQTHTQTMQHLLLFHCNNGCTTAPQCYVCMHIVSLQINQPTRYINLSDFLLVFQIQINMFRASSCPPPGATTSAVVASGLPPELGDSSVVGRGRAGRSDHDQQHCYHHVPMVNQRRLLEFISSWWWTRECPKHVELYLNEEQ